MKFILVHFRRTSDVFGRFYALVSFILSLSFEPVHDFVNHAILRLFLSPKPEAFLLKIIQNSIRVESQKSRHDFPLAARLMLPGNPPKRCERTSEQHPRGFSSLSFSFLMNNPRDAVLFPPFFYVLAKQNV